VRDDDLVFPGDLGDGHPSTLHVLALDLRGDRLTTAKEGIAAQSDNYYHGVLTSSTGGYLDALPRDSADRLLSTGQVIPQKQASRCM
jgi:hypothetical protein